MAASQPRLVPRACPVPRPAIRRGSIEMGQGVTRLADIPQAVLGIRREAAPDQGAQAGGDPVGQGVEVGITVDDRAEDIGHRFPAVQPLARQHLIEDDAEGPDVRALVDLLAAGLLGAHVGRRAHDDPGHGHRRGNGRRGQHVVLPGRLARVRPRQAEIQDLDRAFRVDPHVGGLEIAMHDAAFVGGLEAERDLAGDAHRFVHRERPALQEDGQVFAGDVFHGQEARTLGLLVAVDRGDVGMLQARQGDGFTLETRGTFRVTGNLEGKDLESDLAAEMVVPGPVHLSHAPFADLGQDLIVSEFLADH